MKINDDYEAFVTALWLAVTAPTINQANAALEYALKLEEILSEFEVARAKKEIELRLDKWKKDKGNG